LLLVGDTTGKSHLSRHVEGKIRHSMFMGFYRLRPHPRGLPRLAGRSASAAQAHSRHGPSDRSTAQGGSSSPGFDPAG